MSTASLSRAEHHRPALVFLRHLGGMTLAMFVGMFAFGLALGVTAGVAGSSLETMRVSQPELFMLGMCSAMSVAMVAWMRHRGHSWGRGWEMTAAMFVPVLGVLASYWAGALTADAVCPLSCVLMIPAMAAAMLFRLDDYTMRRAHAAAPDQAPAGRRGAGHAPSPVTGGRAPQRHVRLRRERDLDL